MDVVQHCLHLIGWLLLRIVVRFQLGTFVESRFALEETSDSSAKKKNRSVISGLVRPRSEDKWDPFGHIQGSSLLFESDKK